MTTLPGPEPCWQRAFRTRHRRFRLPPNAGSTGRTDPGASPAIPLRPQQPRSFRCRSPNIAYIRPQALADESSGGQGRDGADQGPSEEWSTRSEPADPAERPSSRSARSSSGVMSAAAIQQNDKDTKLLKPSTSMYIQSRRQKEGGDLRKKLMVRSDSCPGVTPTAKEKGRCRCDERTSCGHPFFGWPPYGNRGHLTRLDATIRSKHRNLLGIVQRPLRCPLP